MIDIAKEIEAAQREVGVGRIAAGEGRTIRIRRTYAAAIDDVWDALTDPRRIGRWFLPISGDYRIGGRFRFEGNAGGTIVACERPNRLRVTWVYGEPASETDISELEIRLTASGEEATELVLEHTAIVPDEMWDQFGPGAVGVGWDQGMLGLSLHLRGDPSRTRWPGSCPTRGVTSPRAAAPHGAKRIAAPGPMSRPSPEAWPTPPASMRPIPRRHRDSEAAEPRSHVVTSRRLSRGR
jgi:uncharacterized protein YndB with AHSA1/START domain